MQLELLAPARNADIAIDAIMHGADAVYMGGPSHGARVAAANSLEDIDKVVRFAHGFGARVYVTLNTLIYDHELSMVEKTVRDYWQIGVDALIVQDMALLRLDLPPIALHASTQCDIRTPEKAAFLAACGFSQLVLPREFSLAQISAVRSAVPTDVALEAFVHGALCVSYSGDCQASCVANGRSANRGECAQMCRMAYDLVDGNGNTLMRDRHLLSLRDLCRLGNIRHLAEAGISSFKIEGRLKDASYVRTVVAAYRKEIDSLIAAEPEKYERSSLGLIEYSFSPDVNKAFNRGFTPYFLNATGKSGAMQGMKMATLLSPKATGEKIGIVENARGKVITAKLSTPLDNGDGVGFFDEKGRFSGFRVNKAEGNLLHLASPVNIKRGTALYRNLSIAYESQMAKTTARRQVPIDAVLSADGLLLRVAQRPNSLVVKVALECDLQDARTPQKEQRQRVISKLGDTRYVLRSLDDQLSDMAFIPASTLADIRRRATMMLDSLILTRHKYDYRSKEDFNAIYPSQQPLTYHDNVANAKAKQFYESHGATVGEKAIECQDQSAENNELAVMTTRYCLRRELGACLLDKTARKLTAPLMIKNKAATYRLDFDCANCQMKVMNISCRP